MAATPESIKLRERVRRLESLLLEVEKFKDPEARNRTKEIVEILLDFHGAALEQIMEHLSSKGESGLSTIDELGRHELVSSVLLLYGLHPLAYEARVQLALDSVGAYLHAHGGSVKLVGISEGVVRLRLEGSCDGCPSSAATLKNTIEEAIWEKAPDTIAIEVHGVADSSPPADSKLPEQRSTNLSLPVLAG